MRSPCACSRLLMAVSPSWCPWLLKGFLQLGDTFRRPFQQTHRIAFGLQRVLPNRPASWDRVPPAFFSLPPPPRIRFPGVNRSPASNSRRPALIAIFGDPCFSCDQHDIPALFGFQRQKLPPLLLIEQLMHLLIFFRPIVLLHAQEYSTSHSLWSTYLRDFP